MKDKLFWQTKDKKEVKSFSPLQVDMGLNKGLIALTDEDVEVFLNSPKTEEQIFQEKIQEAQTYLTQTDWVETYKLRHELGLELIPQDSNKWEVINKREEHKTFLKSIGGN